MQTAHFVAMPEAMASGLDRRNLLRQAGTAGIALAASTVAPARALARQTTPEASPATAARAAGFAYAGTYTRGAPGGGGTLEPVGISVFSVDAATGALTLVKTVAADNPSWLALHPTLDVLFAVNETDDYGGEASGSVEAYAIDPATGTLTALNEQSSEGLWPAHLTVDPTGKFAVVADYSGPFAVLPIQGDGQLAPASDIVQNLGSGPNAERQEASHPHAVVFDPAGQFLATADLGIDKVQIFRLTAAGAFEPVSEASMAPGAGPRHLAFLRDSRVLYVANELNATVTAFAYDAATGAIGAEIQTVAAVPDEFPDPASGAEIAVHPSGRFLYVSNRGAEDAASPVADSIVGFTIDQTTGELTLIDYFAAGIDFPRHFTIDPTGAWLYACNQQGDSIVQFAIDQETGALTATGQVTATPTPVCLVFRQT